MARMPGPTARFAAIRNSSTRPVARSASSPIYKDQSCASALSRRPDQLAAGARFRLDLDRAPATGRRAPLPHPESSRRRSRGLELLLDDGKVRLETESCGAGYADSVCRVGGACLDRKGVNVPNAFFPLSPLTAKDRSDLAFALDRGGGLDRASPSSSGPTTSPRGASWSLVGPASWSSSRSRRRSRVYARLSNWPRPLMVARGDLRVEMPPEDVPTIKRRWSMPAAWPESP